MECNIFKECQFLTFLLCLAVLFTGCMPGPIATFKVDVSDKKELWGDYNNSLFYKLKHDMFLEQYEYYPLIKNAHVLVPPRELTRGVSGLLYSAPESFNDYYSLPNNWPEVVGIVSEGTTIQCYKLIEYQAVGYGNSLYLYGKIVDGVHKDTIVELSDLSLSGQKNSSGLRLMAPNPKFLEQRE